MAQIVKAADYLAAPQKHPAQPVCVVFGDEAFLKRQVHKRLRESVFGAGEADFSLAGFEGPEADVRDVLEELFTVAMFGPGKRLVVVEQADEFVTRYRPQLEQYVEKPSRTGVLVLDVKSWPATTRLYKSVAATGLGIDCAPLKGRQVSAWAAAWAKQAHGFQLSQSAAETLVELAGEELGLLDQELAKLALVAGAGGKATPEQVAQSAGAWRSKTVWEMLDAALDGNLRAALVQLDQLMLAGETPVGILAQIGASLRRFAAATRIILETEAAGRRVAVRDALKEAGVNGYFLEKSERQIRRLGRARGARLYSWLLEADLDLKGDSPLPPRLVLERLLVRLGAEDTARTGPRKARA